MDLDLIIHNGLVVDGSGNPGAVRDIGIREGKVAVVGDLRGRRAGTTLDAAGRVVCPGFIDIHAHSEYHLLIHPQAESKVRQGVTTEVCGNCGLSAAPLFGEVKERRQTEYIPLGLDPAWSTLSEYYRLLERSGIGVNFTTLIGHGNLRGSILGYQNRKATSDELSRMQTLMGQAMADGALGLSTGLIYPPGVYAGREEIIALASVAAQSGGIYATHMRSEGDGLLEAIDESIDICRRAGLPLEISHLKTSGQANWHKLGDAFGLIESARREGVEVHCDRYPYTAASTDLDVVLPAWAYEGGHASELTRLRDPATRKRLAEEIRKTRPYVDAWDRILIGTVATGKNRPFEGKTLTEIAQIRNLERGKEMDPLEVLFDLLVEENLQVGAHFFSMCEDNLAAILQKPYAMIGSDSSVRSYEGPLSCGKPHPRGFGSFPRVLETYVRKEQLLTLEDAVYKMTGLPAAKLKLRDRGRIREGFWADLVVFDLEGLTDLSTFQQPFQPPRGIEHVLVNGTFVVREGEPTGALPGQILKNNRSGFSPPHKPLP